MPKTPSTTSRPMGPLALAGFAVGAAVLYQFALLFPLALALALPVLFYGNVFLIGAAVFGFLVLAWIIQPAAAPSPPALVRDQALTLYGWLDDLCQRMNAPRIHSIALDDNLNAGALELNRGASLKPTRCVLVLGVPLLATLGPKALEAVVAHELGHFSRRHGRLGHWLYRTRRAWESQLVASLDHDSAAWERACAVFAEWFVPWFSVRSFAHARHCEFEADALAARTVGAQAMGAALAQISLAAIRFERWTRTAINDAQQECAQPPADWLQRSASAIAPSAPTSEERQCMLDPAAGADTHPPMLARWQALGLNLDILEKACEPESVCAGETWFGPRWQGLLAEHNAAWAALQVPVWPMRNAMLRPLRARLMALRDAGTVDLERLRLEWTVRDSKGTVAVARDLLSAGKDCAAVWFRIAVANLAERRTEGVLDLLHQSLSESAGWVAPARALIDREADLLGLDSNTRDDNARLYAKACERERVAADAMRARAEAGEAKAPQLDSIQREALAAALGQHNAIKQAWCVSSSVALDSKRSYAGNVLVARLDPSAMNAMGLTEEQCAHHIELMLNVLTESDVLTCVRTSFTTEGLPEPLQRRLGSLQGSLLI